MTFPRKLARLRERKTMFVSVSRTIRAMAVARWQILWKNEVDEIIPLIKSDLAYLKDLVGFTDSYQNGADTRMQENPCQRHLGECLPAFLSNIIQFSYLEYRLFCDIVCSQENS